jgi:hypothetical protein
MTTRKKPTHLNEVVPMPRDEAELGKLGAVELRQLVRQLVDTHNVLVASEHSHKIAMEAVIARYGALIAGADNRYHSCSMFLPKESFRALPELTDVRYKIEDDGIACILTCPTDLGPVKLKVLEACKPPE